MSMPTLNWSSANVSDAKLTVELEGEISSDWKKSFRTTARLLGRSNEFGEVELKKRKVSVDHVSEGTEEKLRHFLESAVEQANAVTFSEQEEEETDEDASTDEARSDDGPDAHMRDRFRSFADDRD